MKMMTKKTLITALLIISGNVYAQTPEAAKDSTKANKNKNEKHLGTLFKNDSLLRFTIVTDLKALLRDRGTVTTNHLAVLKYDRKEKKQIDIPIKIKVRGNFRRLPANCYFPPLLIDIDKKKKGNAIFDYQNKLKLVTHCINEDYIFQEYLVYKVFNLLTDASFKARLASVTYIDSLAKRETETKLAFLLEDETDLAKRNDAKVSPLKQLRAGQLDIVSMATVSVFEFMIGNTDWSVPYLHNIKLLNKEGFLPIPVPYDFDHSGIIEAKYALPPEGMDLISVRERLYRGINYPPTVFQQVFDNFKKLKPQIYALYEGNLLLKPNYIKRTIKYLDEFYEIIDNPKMVKRDIVEIGIKNQGGGVTVKGLK
jgi:hypothetical protein